MKAELKNAKSDFIHHCLEQLPLLKSTAFSERISDQLICPMNFVLPPTVLPQVQRLASLVDKIVTSQIYQDMVFGESDPKAGSTVSGTCVDFNEFKKATHRAICNSYDLHLTADGEIRLIEINTDAAFYFLGAALAQSRGLSFAGREPPLQKMRKRIEEECATWTGAVAGTLVNSIAITDQNPSEQKLYSEFLYFQEWGKAQGWQTDILNTEDLLYIDSRLQSRTTGEKTWDFIYNRSTDFLFSEKISEPLKSAYLSRALCVSPHPKEYALLANKMNLQILRDADLARACGLDKHQIDFLQQVIPVAEELRPDNKDHIWSHRKEYFFKPAQSFGSKQAFRGASISRKAFEEYFNNEGKVIAQGYWPALELEVPSGTSEEQDRKSLEGITADKFKYDLRFYFYKNAVDFGLARLYEGQVTNLRAQGGGFSPLQFTNRQITSPELQWPALRERAISSR